MPDQQQDTSTASDWMECMRLGHFEEAWQITDRDMAARQGAPTWHLPRHFQSIWNGDTIEGKRVLVRCYHGLGDTIQFIRYAPLLKARAKELIVWAQEPLIPLLRTMPSIDRLLPLHNGSPDADYDVDVEVMELPYLFRSTPATLPSDTPYLYATPSQLPVSHSKPNVGLVWKAGDWDERRSIPFEILQPLWSLSHVNLIILQGEARAAGWHEGCGIYPGSCDLEQYARYISALDLLITVDSMPAHLAGALHIPVWTLLHAEADWRWMRHRTDSPWYPSMELIRQKQQGDWWSMIQLIKKRLLIEFPAV